MPDREISEKRASQAPDSAPDSEFATGWTDRLRALPLPVRVALVLLLLALIAALDNLTGGEISFSIFYLAPVIAAGSLISSGTGRLVALASAAVWGYLEIRFGRPYSHPLIAYWNSLIRLGFFLLVNELFAQLHRAHLHERVLARMDSLTGIPNARVFVDRVERAIARSRRAGSPFTIAFVDLDRFKQVNDAFGHSEGDSLLHALAQHIQSGLRSTDSVSRMGGDEFGILLPDTALDQAAAVLGRVARRIEEGVASRWMVAATIGAVTFGQPPESADSAIRAADELMYEGKARGRGCLLQATWPATPERAGESGSAD